MLNQHRKPAIKAAFLTGTLVLGALVSSSGAQTTAPNTQTAAPPAHPATAAAPYRFQPARSVKRETLYYGMLWGVDSLNVKWAESGELVRFSWRVLDAEKAKPLNDKKSEPSLMDPAAQVKLVVPSLEKVGMLRQSSTPIAGRSYWMAFSNKGRLVKRGDRVTIQIGNFRADGLVVE